MVRRGIYLLTIIFSASLMAACRGQADQTQSNYTIVIIEVEENRDDRFVSGVMEELAVLGYIEGENITYLRGELSSLITNETFVARDFDAYFVYRGASLLELLDEKNDNIPVVATNIVEAPGSELFVGEDGYPTGQFTGAFVGEAVELTYLELLAAINPQLDTVYIPVADEDTATLTALEDLDALATELDITLVIDNVEASEIEAAIADLPDDVDAILTLTGVHETETTCQLWRSAATQVSALYQGVGAHIIGCEPLFRPQFGSGQGGAPHELTAGQLALVLQGTPVTEIPFDRSSESELTVNEEMAGAVGIIIDEAFLTEYGLVLFDALVLPNAPNGQPPGGDSRPEGPPPDGTRPAGPPPDGTRPAGPPPQSQGS